MATDTHIQSTDGGSDLMSMLLKALTGGSGTENSTGSKTSTNNASGQTIQDLLSTLAGKNTQNSTSKNDQLTQQLQQAIQNATGQTSQVNQQTGSTQQNTSQLTDQISKLLQSQQSNQQTSQNQVQQNNTGSVTTTGSNISEEGMQHLINQALSSAGGVADIATGAHATGLYNSTTQQQLTNDLITRTAGELAAKKAGTTSTTQNNGSITTTGGSTVAGSSTSAQAGSGSTSQTGQNTTLTDMLSRLLSNTKSSQVGSTATTGSTANTGSANSVTDTSQNNSQHSVNANTGSSTSTDNSTNNTAKHQDSPASNFDWGSLLKGVGAAGAGSVLGPILGQLFGGNQGGAGSAGVGGFGNIAGSIVQLIKGAIGGAGGGGNLTIDTGGAGNAGGINGGDAILPDVLRGGGMGNTAAPDNQAISPIVADSSSGNDQQVAEPILNFGGDNGPTQVDGSSLDSDSGNANDSFWSDWFKG